MEQMTPAVERLVRLMILLPKHHDQVWDSVIDDCGDISEVMSMRWFVGDTARMWPEAAPHNLATSVLTAFSAPSEKTLGLISDAILRSAGRGPQAGAAWVAQANAAAVEVLAQARSWDEVLQEVKEQWTLGLSQED